MTKPTSVKFPKEMLADIDNECQGLGCNRTDFIRNAVQEKLDGKVQGQEEKPIPEAKVIKMSDDDGKTWYDVPEEEPNPKDPSTWKSNKKSPKQIKVISI